MAYDWSSVATPLDDNASPAAPDDRGSYGSGGVEDTGTNTPVPVNAAGAIAPGGKPANMADIPAGATDVSYDPATGEVIGYKDQSGKLVVNIHRNADPDPFAQVADPVSAPETGVPVKPQLTGWQDLGVGTRDLLGSVGQGANFITAPIRALQHAIGFGDVDYEKTADALSDKLGLPRVPDDGHVGSAFRRGLGLGIITAGSGSLAAGLDGAVGMVGSALGQAPVVQSLASGTGAAAGEATREAGYGPLAQTGASLLAGGAVAVPSIATDLARPLIAQAATQFTRAGAEQQAAQIIRNAAAGSGDDIVDSIRNAPAPVSDARPTLAEVAGDSGIAGLQQRHVNTNIGGGAPAISNRFAENALARTRAAQDTLGHADAQPLQDYAQGQLAQGQAETTAQQSQRQGAAEQRIALSQSQAANNRVAAQRQLRESIERLGPTADRDATGETARQAFSENYRAAKARTNAAYNDPRLLADEPVQLRPLDYHDVALPDGPAQAGSVDNFKADAVTGARGALPREPQSLLQFVRSHGGIDINDANAGDIRHIGMDSRNNPTLLSRNGMPLDTLRELAEEQGFIPEGTHLPDFIDALDKENRGLTRTVRQEDLGDQFQHEAASDNRDFWRRAFDDRGLDPLKMTDEQWQQFYNEMKPGRETSRTFADMDREPSVGSPMGPFQKTLSGLRDQFYGDGGNEAPAYIKSFFREVLNADTVGIRKLEGWERRAYDLAGQAPDRANASFMQAVGRAIGGKAAAEGGSARQAALRAARAARREQGRVFETGDVSKAFAVDKYQNPIVGNNAIPSRLVRPGAAGGDTANSLIATLGHQGAESAVRQELRRIAEEKGVQTAAQARSLAVNYGEAARRFPAVQADLDQLQARAARLDDANADLSAAARLRPTEDEVAAIRDRSALHIKILRSPLAKLADQGTDPSSFVRQLLGRADDGRQLKALGSMVSKDPDAVNGLRRSLGDYIKEAGQGPNFTAPGDRIPSVNKTREAIATVVKRASTVLTNEQRITLKLIERELEQTNFALTATKPAGSDTAINKTFADLMNAAPDIPFVSSKAKMIGRVAAVLTNKDEVHQLITQSILDPDFAATLLKRPTPRHWLQIQHGMIGRKVAASAALLGRPLTGANDINITGGQAAAAAQSQSSRKTDQRERP